MKRDMDLVREILLMIEASNDSSEVELIAQEGESQAVFDYHIALLVDAHLIQANKTSFGEGSSPWEIERLTWDGHEFLEAAKNDNIWEKAKRFIRDKGGAATFDVIKTVLAQAALKQIGL